MLRCCAITGLAAIAAACGETNAPADAENSAVVAARQPNIVTIRGTAAATGPGREIVADCNPEEPFDNLMFMTFHAPGEIVGSGQGGSVPPSISMSRGLNLEKQPNTQRYELNVNFFPEEKTEAVTDKIAGKLTIATLSFGDKNVPLIHLDMSSAPLTTGYHAFFPFMHETHPLFGNAVTGVWWAHAHARKIGYIYEDDVWSRAEWISIFDSIRTSPCVANYAREYVSDIYKDAQFKVE